MRPGGCRHSALCWTFLLLAVGVGSFSDTAFAGAAPTVSASGPLRASATSGGLHVTVTAARTQRSEAERFTIRAVDAHARGALGYDIAFGDGTDASIAVPQFCLSGDGVARRARWHVDHRYPAGTYHVNVTVRANCTKTAATARLTVRPR